MFDILYHYLPPLKYYNKFSRFFYTYISHICICFGFSKTFIFKKEVLLEHKLNNNNKNTAFFLIVITLFISIPLLFINLFMNNFMAFLAIYAIKLSTEKLQICSKKSKITQYKSIIHLGSVKCQ